jgi:glycosyltransferase involved in cell wall biosynthesis
MVHLFDIYAVLLRIFGKFGTVDSKSCQFAKANSLLIYVDCSGRLLDLRFDIGPFERSITTKNLVSLLLFLEREEITLVLSIVLCIDGKLLPSAEGATFRFLELARSLANNFIKVTVVLGDRGWSDRNKLLKEPFKTVFVDPSDFHFGVTKFSHLMHGIAPDIIQCNDPEVIWRLVSREIYPEALLWYEVHDLPDSNSGFSCEYRKHTLIAAALADVVTCLNEEETNAAKLFFEPEKPIFTSPCTVSINEKGKKRHIGKGTKVGFLGNFYYEPNALAVRYVAKEVWPRLLQKNKDAELHLFGNFPPSLNEELAGNNFQWHGVVDDPIESLQAVDVGCSILPKGSGVRIKMLHYLAAGLPVVANNLGVAGFDILDEVLLSEQPEEQSVFLDQLLRNPKQRSGLADLGWRLLKKNHNSADLAKLYKKIISQLPGSLSSKGTSRRFKERELTMRAFYGDLEFEKSATYLSKELPPWLVENIAKNRFDIQ